VENYPEVSAALVIWLGVSAAKLLSYVQRPIFYTAVGVYLSRKLPTGSSFLSITL